jgi:PAS domain S-box-containing protein
VHQSISHPFIPATELREPPAAEAQGEEVTRLKAGTTEAETTKARMEVILNGIADGFYSLDANWRFTYVNKAAEKILGRSMEQLLGTHFWEEYSHVLGSEVEHEFRRAAAKQISVEFEYFSPRWQRWFDIKAYPGAVGELSVNFRDITDARTRDHVNRQFAAIVEFSDDAIISKDLKGIIMSWNPGAERIFGYSADEVLGKPITILIPPDRQNEEPNILSRILNGERIDHYETIRCRKDGTLVDISLTVSPIRDGLGKVIGASKIARDITQRKQSEHEQRALYELASSVNRAGALPGIYDAALDAICRCHRIRRASILLAETDGVMRFKAWRGLSDHYRQVVEGHGPWKLDEADLQPVQIDDVDNVTPAGLDSTLRAVMQAEGVQALLFVPISSKNRLLGKFMLCQEVPHHFTAEETRLAQTIAAQVAFALERQRSGEALELLVAERTVSLQNAMAQMEEFSYSVSHDLRAPVRAMQGYARAVLEDYGERLDAHGKNYLERIIRSGSRMDRLIHDILIYSRLSQREIRLQPVSLARLVPEIVQQYPGLQPPTSIEVQEPLLEVLGHEPSLVQAISNLLSNAVKFVAPGTLPRIQLQTERRGGQIRFCVKDNGIGIRPAHQHRLFGMFERIHPEDTYEGTGIGLAIVRKAVERMGGQVGVESDGVNGSRFWIQLPAANPL